MMKHSGTRAKSIALFVFVVLCAALAFVLFPTSSRSTSEVEIAPSSRLGPSAVEVKLNSEGVVESERRASGSEPNLPAATEGTPPSIRVSGRVIDLDGMPISDAILRLVVASLDIQSPGAGSVRMVSSDANGGFELQLELSSECEVMLSASAVGHVDGSWTWLVGRKALQKDLGDVLLLPLARVTCVARAQDGRLISGRGWAVVAEQASLSLADGRSPHVVRRQADPASGHFVFDSVPAGLVSFRLQGGHGVSVGHVRLQVEAGQDHFVEITSDFPELLDRIHVRVMCRPFGSVQAKELASVHAEDAVGRRYHAQPPREGMPWYWIPGCSDGDHVVRVDGPAFQPWSLGGVRPGDFVAAEIVGNVSGRIVLVQASAVRPPEQMELEVRMRGPDRSPAPRTILGQPTDADAVSMACYPALRTGSCALVGSDAGFCQLWTSPQVKCARCASTSERWRT